VTAPAPDKRAEAVKVAGELLSLMDLAHSLEIKDADDGGLSLAVKLEAEFAPAQKRSPFTDAFQLLVNKLVNRPGQDRRFIAIGFGGHPPPRPPRQAQQAQATPAPLAAPAAAAPAPSPAPPARKPAPPPAPRAEDESALSPAEDPALTAEIRKLAELSARLGRFYALAAVGPEDRARVLKAAAGVPGVKVGAAGEGRNRRVVFTPDKPVAMPRRTLPADDDEEID
jgi:hypothetical protein